MRKRWTTRRIALLIIGVWALSSAVDALPAINYEAPGPLHQMALLAAGWLFATSGLNKKDEEEEQGDDHA